MRHLPRHLPGLRRAGVTDPDGEPVRAGPPPPPRPAEVTAATARAPAGAIAATSTTASRASAGCSSLARHPGARRHQRARRRDGGRRPVPPRRGRTAPAPATVTLAARVHRVAIGVEEYGPVVVGDETGRPEPGRPGEVPRRVADAEVVDVDEQPRRGRGRAGRVGRGASRRAPASSAGPVSRPATPRRAARPPHAGRCRWVPLAACRPRAAAAAASRAAEGACGAASRCSRARSCAASTHGAQSGWGATVSTLGQRVFQPCSGALRAWWIAETAANPTPRRCGAGLPACEGRCPTGAVCRRRCRRRRSLHRTGSAPLNRISDVAAAVG